MTRIVPTAEFASFVYGREGVRDDDATETYHEASLLYPSIAPVRLGTMIALSRRPELQQTVARAGRRQGHRPGLDLPRRALPSGPFRDLLAARRSAIGRERRTLRLVELGAVLEASYAVCEREPGVLRRPVPSGGALYPLELYILVLAVEDVEPSVAHYDPFRHRLELLAPLVPADARSALVDGALLDGAAAVLVLTALFWRTRVKYGPRGYRFALLEAGHVVQNAVLAAGLLGLPTLPLGGFYDRRLDALVGADGLDEASLYALLIGGGE